MSTAKLRKVDGYENMSSQKLEKKKKKKKKKNQHHKHLSQYLQEHLSLASDLDLELILDLYPPSCKNLDAHLHPFQLM